MKKKKKEERRNNYLQFCVNIRCKKKQFWPFQTLALFLFILVICEALNLE